MTGVKTNERPGTRAVLRYGRLSAYKVRQVLDLIRGQDVDRAAEILATCDREAAAVVGKLLTSAVANAAHNDQLDAEDLYVSACYADEASTLKRWRPRARGRATRIRKRTSHVTIIVSRLPEDRLARRRAKQAASGTQRSRRVAGSRRRQRAETEVATRPAPTPEVDELEGFDDETVDDFVDELDDETVEDFDDEVADEAADESADEDEAADETADEDEATDEIADEDEGDADDVDEAAEATAEDETADAKATSSDETSGDSAEEKGK